MPKVGRPIEPIPSEKEIRRRIRLYSKGDANGCWVWIGSDGKSRPKLYPYIFYRRTMMRANRVSYMVHWGVIPDRKVVMHTCDNRLCVNPYHLIVGTQAENLKDCRDKKRHLHGSRVPWSKLTEEKVLEIRRRNIAGEGYKRLGSAYGISAGVVRNAVLGRTWKHVPGAVERLPAPPSTHPKGLSNGTEASLDQINQV